MAPRKQPSPADGVGKAIVAAAQRYAQKLFRPGKQNIEKSWKDRQAKAYTYWDDTPEVRFSGIWVGRAMGRSRLFAGIRQRDGSILEADENHPATILVRGMAGGSTGQSQMLEAMGPHLVVAGEGWIVINPEGDSLVEPEESWHTFPVTAFKESTKNGFTGLEVEIDDQDVWIPPDGVMLEDPMPQPVAIRIWNPHPTNYALPDSPVMSSFTILEELRLLNAAVAAIAKSRLVGRGLLVLPAGVQLPGGGDVMETLITIAETAYKDPSSAAAGVPVVVEIPKESGEVKRITFESEFDELCIKLREEAIRRYATASDTPAEILLGQGDMNHWGVWALQDEAIRVGVEPRLATVCDGLTQQWLWPALGSDEAVVWYDTSGLRARTNRGETAIELFDRKAINATALRRETDFEEGDAPQPISVLDRAVDLAIGMVKDAPTLIKEVGLPSLVEQLVTILDKGGSENIVRDIVVGDDAPPEVDLPVEGPPTDIPDADEGTPPDQSDADILAAAVDRVIVRALERAGSRIRRTRGRQSFTALKGVAPHHTHTKFQPTADQLSPFLEGAWDGVEEIAKRYDINEQCLTDVLDEYARDLLQSGTPHAYEAIPVLIRQASCLQLA